MKKTKILNLIIDEKFIEGLINSNSLLEEEIHDYVIISDDAQKEFTYIYKLDKINRLTSKEFIVQLKKGNYDAIFLHSIRSLPWRLYGKIPKKIPLFWFSWGFDIYDIPYDKPCVPISLYHPHTKKIIEAKKIFEYKLGKRLFSLRRLQNIVVRYYYKCALKRIDYHSGVLPFETDLIKRYNPYFKAKQVFFNYVDPDSYLDFVPTKGNDILIGNSASPSNNHADLLEILKKISLEGHNIIMPLSYAGDAKYVEEVKKQYVQRFKNSFIPLISYTEKEVYYRLLDQCAIAIFYIERQQAIGNINYCLRTGKKVFLSETSEMYKYYKNRGFVIFSIQSDLIKHESLVPLDVKEQINNYNLIKAGALNWRNNRKIIREEIERWNLKSN